MWRHLAHRHRGYEKAGRDRGSSSAVAIRTSKGCLSGRGSSMGSHSARPNHPKASCNGDRWSSIRSAASGWRDSSVWLPGSTSCLPRP